MKMSCFKSHKHLMGLLPISKKKTKQQTTTPKKQGIAKGPSQAEGMNQKRGGKNGTLGQSWARFSNRYLQLFIHQVKSYPEKSRIWEITLGCWQHATCKMFLNGKPVFPLGKYPQSSFGGRAAVSHWVRDGAESPQLLSQGTPIRAGTAPAPTSHTLPRQGEGDSW